MVIISWVVHRLCGFRSVDFRAYIDWTLDLLIVICFGCVWDGLLFGLGRDDVGGAG